LDTTFGTSGVTEVGKLLLDPTGRADFGRGVAIQTDGKIIAAGYGGVPTDYNVQVYRLNDDGTLDTSFHSDGLVSLSIDTNIEVVTSVVLQPDDKILVAGSSGTHALFSRLMPTGTPDTSFDT